MNKWIGPKPKIIITKTDFNNYDWSIVWKDKIVRSGCTGNHGTALSQAKRNRKYIMNHILSNTGENT